MIKNDFPVAGNNNGVSGGYSTIQSAHQYGGKCFRLIFVVNFLNVISFLLGAPARTSNQYGAPGKALSQTYSTCSKAVKQYKVMRPFNAIN